MPNPDLLGALGGFVQSAAGQLALSAATAMFLAGLGAVIHASTTARKIAQVFADVAALAKPLVDQAAASGVPALKDAAAIERQAVETLAQAGVIGDGSRVLTQDLPEVAAAVADALKPAQPPNPPAPAK